MSRSKRRRMARRKNHEAKVRQRSAAAAGRAAGHTRSAPGGERVDPAAVAGQLESAVARTWDRGWQPADLVHALRRELKGDALDVLRAAIAADAVGYTELGRRVAPEWMHQLDAIGAVPWWEPGRCFVEELGTGRVRAVAGFLTATLERLPRLQPLTPPPSRWHDDMATRSAGGVSDELLAKVRALLAKAESTHFDEEAAAFTAKAQELMTRHRIDRAMLAHTDPAGGADGPGGRRILVDDPYAQAKFALLHAVAGANGVRAVWSRGFGFATVVGYPTDLDVVEELFTSLLVQATSAMAREGAKTDASGRSRTRRFRRTFLLAYGARIGERLVEATDTTVHEAEEEYGTALVPVLAARDEEVQRATEEAFPQLGTMQMSASDPEGWYAGTTHADLADLSAGAPLRR